MKRILIEVTQGELDFLLDILKLRGAKAEGGQRIGEATNNDTILEQANKHAVYCKLLYEKIWGGVDDVNTPFERLIVERNDLLIKLNKLMAFTVTDKFKSLNEASATLLIMQQHEMQKYMDILRARITHWED